MIIALIYGFIFAFFGLTIIKTFVTGKRRQSIIYAIYIYQSLMIEQYNFDFKVGYSDMESFDRTLWRLWDWGYKRILPADKYKIIKPYIIPIPTIVKEKT